MCSPITKLKSCQLQFFSTNRKRIYLGDIKYGIGSSVLPTEDIFFKCKLGHPSALQHCLVG